MPEPSVYHPRLPAVPARLQARPVHRSMPVPWFNGQVNGQWDFRYIQPGRLEEAIRARRCWICGEQLGKYLAFVLGPIGAMNRITSEPASHRECAVFAIQACPFLLGIEQQRRTSHAPVEITMPEGCLAHNPGLVVLWITQRYRLLHVNQGVVIEPGDATEVVWFAAGEIATTAQIQAGLDVAVSKMREQATQHREDAEGYIRESLARLRRLMPKEMIDVPRDPQDDTSLPPVPLPLRAD